MLVLDTTALVAALLGRPSIGELGTRLSHDRDLHVPHLVDVEFLHVLRRLVGTGELTSDRASDARQDFDDLALVRYSHEPLAERIWQLRYNLTAYDATFVALAEALGVSLITCDAALAGASGHVATVEVFR